MFSSQNQEIIFYEESVIRVKTLASYLTQSKCQKRVVAVTMVLLLFLTLQRKDFPSNSFYVVVVVKTEDQACGGSLPYYPFVEGTLCASVLAEVGACLLASWELEEAAWLLADLRGRGALAPDSPTLARSGSRQAPL